MKTPLIASLILIAAAALPAQEYQIDATHSALIFGIQHIGLGNTYGMIPEFSGSISFDEDDPASGSVSVTAQVASINTFSKKRDDHLRNADFFDAGTHPTITFEGKGFEPVEGEDGHYTVTGDLTIRGTTKEVTVPFHLVGKGEHAMAKKPAIGFEGEFTIDRNEFGVGVGKVSGAVGKDVRIIVSLEAIAP